MIVGCVRLMWWLLKPARLLTRLLIYMLLITMPFWGLSFICGFVDGGIMSCLRFRYNDLALELFLAEMELARFSDSFEVPGAPMAKFTQAPLHIPQIKKPLHWWRIFDLVRRERADMRFQDVTLDPLTRLSLVASPHGLYRKKASSGDDESDWHHWIYVTADFFYDDIFSNTWDQAFNELLQYHAANPPAHNASFHYISCSLSSLCSLWRIKGPALIHMTTERPARYGDFFEADGDGELGQQESPLFWDGFPEFAGHDKVKLRVAELPISDPNRDPYILPPGRFPSQFEQLRSITSDEHIWQEFPLMDETQQMFSVLEEYSGELEKTHKQTYGRLQQLEQFVVHSIGFEDSELEMVVILLGIFWGSRFVHYAILLYRQLFAYGYYPGATTQQDVITALWHGELGVPNFMETALNEFLVQLPDDMKRTLVEKEEMVDLLHKARNITKHGVAAE